jgi:hypothetical protein
MNANQVVRKSRRLPGEIAFDRCFFPIAALFTFNIVWWILSIRQDQTFKPPTEADLAAELPPPAWHLWLSFALGLVFAVLWFRALASVLRAWRDPSSRILRFSASVLLVPFAIAACRLLLTPFQ